MSITKTNEEIARDPDGTVTRLIYQDGVPVLHRETPRAVRDARISANRADQNGFSRHGNGMRRVASIDQSMFWQIYQLWCGSNGRNHARVKKGGPRAMMKDQEFLWSVLNNPDFKWMRTTPGNEGPRVTHRQRKHFIL